MPRSVQLSKNLIKNDTDRLTLISGPCLLENEKLGRSLDLYLQEIILFECKCAQRNY